MRFQGMDISKVVRGIPFCVSLGELNPVQ